MACQVPVPDPKFGTGNWIDREGTSSMPGTPGAFRAAEPAVDRRADQACDAGRELPRRGLSDEPGLSAYIRKLQSGMSGFTCYRVAADAARLSDAALSRRRRRRCACAWRAEGLTLLFHRPSGTTHVLLPPAPECSTLLAEGPADADALAARIAARLCTRR